MLAARIYRELETNCSVVHDAKLAGVLSENTRQIDVLIENENLGTRVIVDCKDRKRPVNIVNASAFAGLMEDVEASRGPHL